MTAQETLASAAAPGASAARAHRAWGAPVLVTAAAAIAVIAVLAALSPRWLIFDERYQMEAAYLLRHRFDFSYLMTTPWDAGAGPLYGYLQFFAAPLTGLAAPAVRFVNIVMLAVALAAIGWTTRRLGYRDPVARAAMLLAAPMLASTVGLALTEVPALAMACLAVACAARGSDGNGLARAGWFVVAGVAAGAAILGRQNYLPGLIGFVMVGIAARRLAVPAAIAVVSALVTIAPMLMVWRGLTPPWIPRIGVGLAPLHGVLAFVYLATVIAFIAPRYLTEPFRNKMVRIAGFVALLAVIALASLLDLGFAPGARIIGFLPGPVRGVAGLLVTAAMLALSAVYGIATLFHLGTRRGDRPFALFTILAVVLTGTAAGVVHQFSARYVLVAFPFALLAVQPWLTIGPLAALRLAVGSALGIASLASYYWRPGAPDPNAVWLAPVEILRQMPLIDGPVPTALSAGTAP